MYTICLEVLGTSVNKVLAILEFTANSEKEEQLWEVNRWRERIQSNFNQKKFEMAMSYSDRKAK